MYFYFITILFKVKNFKIDILELLTDTCVTKITNDIIKQEMKQTKAPKKTPSPKQEQQRPDSVVGNDSSSAVFISLALDMSWRLAIVVLVPIVGGFELDKKLNSSPLLTIVGFLLAMAGMALIMMRTLKEANKIALTPTKRGHL
jgi:F0F1-type ATP synthase assembly protein I